MSVLMSEMCRAASNGELDALITESVKYWENANYKKKAVVKAANKCEGTGYLQVTPADAPVIKIDEGASIYTAILIFELP